MSTCGYNGFPDGWNAVYQAAIQGLIRKHNLACEQLTETQLAAVIAQALASGDFIRQVRVTDNAQAVIYIPYAEVESLRTQLADAKAALSEICMINDASSWEHGHTGKMNAMDAVARRALNLTASEGQVPENQAC